MFIMITRLAHWRIFFIRETNHTIPCKAQAYKLKMIIYGLTEADPQ